MKTTTPNPLVPQGSLPDRRGKSQVRIYIFTIVAIHAVFLGALLLQGCKRTTSTDGLAASGDTNFPPPPPIEPSALSSQPPATPPDTAQTTSAPPAIETSQFAPPTTQNVVVPPPMDLPPPQSAPAPGAGTEHVVVAGDVYSKIARKYGVTVRALTEANPGVNPARLKIGQKLVVPAPAAAATTTTASRSDGTTDGQKTYVVKSGDSLMKIARAHSTTVKALRSANQLKTDQIKVGQKLIVPAKGTPDTGVGGTSGAPQTLPAP